MSYQPIEDLLPRADYSVYKLVRLAANRAIELAEGKPKLIKNPSSEKLATIALEEIRNGKVILNNGKKSSKPAVDQDPEQDSKKE